MDRHDVILYQNEITRDGDGWALLAPFGDFRSQAVVIKPDGQVTRLTSIQRLDRQAAETMAENFNSVVGRVKRFFRGVPIFLGHPDVPKFGAAYADKTEKGVIQSLAVRDDGLYALPVFNDAGAELINSAQPLYFSGRWESESAGDQEGLPVFRPSVLRSVGLTSKPHLPTELLNDRDHNAADPEVKLATLIALLQGAGISIANDATEAQAEDAVKGLITKAGEVSTLTGRVTERDTTITSLKTELANARLAHRDELVELAVQTGRITPAEATTWKGRLDASFANERTALLGLQVKIKTDSDPNAQGSRKAAAASFSNAQERLQAFTAEVQRLEKEGHNYDAAFAIIRRTKPELIGA